MENVIRTYSNLKIQCSTCAKQFRSGFDGLEVACWPLEPKFKGSNSAEAVGFFRAKKKFLSRTSFGREVKLWVPCRRFTACKRSPEWYVEFGHFQNKFTGHFSPT
jgi:hypothetical protein